MKKKKEMPKQCADFKKSAERMIESMKKFLGKK